MAILYAIGKRIGRPLPDFKGLKFDTYVWHGDKGDWVLFSVATVDQAGAKIIAKCDLANIIPIGYAKDKEVLVIADAATKLNTWATAEKIANIKPDTTVTVALKEFKKAMRGADWEKELTYEHPQDPEDTKPMIYVYPEEFGAIGDRIHDDASAINEAAAYARSNYKIMRTIPGKSYLCKQQLDLRGISIDSFGMIYPNRVSGAAVLIGNSQNLVCRLTVRNNTISQSVDDIGIKIANAKYCTFDLGASQFGTAILQGDSTGEGSMINRIYLRLIEYDYIGFHVCPSGGGWANECGVYHGEFEDRLTQSIAGIKVTGTNVNGWVFNQPSFEMEYGLPIIIDGAYNNRVYDARLETTYATKPVLYDNKAWGNRVEYKSFWAQGNPIDLYCMTTGHGNRLIIGLDEYSY